MLQCRSGKRTGKAAVKIAVDMVNEGLVDTRAAVKMVEPQHLDQLLHPQVYLLTVSQQSGLITIQVNANYTWTLVNCG